MRNVDGKVSLKAALVLVLVGLMILAACTSAVDTPEPTPVPPTAEPTEVAKPDPDDPPSEVEGPAEQPTAEAAAGICEAAPLPEIAVSPVTGEDWVKGADEDNTQLTIIEYSDFECPGCAGMYPVLQDFLDDNPDIRLVYRHFPLDMHQHAMITAEAAEAAGAQGKFWEMHNLLFDRREDWQPLTDEDILDELSSYAEELDLDVERFDRELENGTYEDKVQAQYDEARELGLPGTPTFIFNNVLFPSDIGLSYQGLSAFLQIVNNRDEIFFDAPPPVTVDEGDEYQATLTTSQGDLVVALDTESAPVNINSFIFLAEESWYDGSNFFFVQDDFVAVSGDPTNSTVGYPGYYCTGEADGVFESVGVVGMLPNGQFFVTLGADAAQLNGQFARIGEVVEGAEILDDLARVVVGDPTAPEPDVVESIIIEQQ
jgi:protein-disulfide isomerase/cyclophilin family peptidyl-prolyl cis-trans isomerase